MKDAVIQLVSRATGMTLNCFSKGFTLSSPLLSVSGREGNEGWLYYNRIHSDQCYNIKLILLSKLASQLIIHFAVMH